MDTNLTRFRHWLTAIDWRDAIDGGGVAPANRAGEPGDFLWSGGSLQRNMNLDLLRAAPLDAPFQLEARRGFGRDLDGSAILVNGARDGLDRLGEDGVPRHWWPPQRGAMALAGAAETTTGYLVFAMEDPPGLVVLDLAALGLPAALRFTVDLRPWDVGARPGGGLVVLDRQGQRLWILDQHLLVCAPPLAVQGDAIAVDVLADDTVVLLMREEAAVTLRRVHLEGGRVWPDQRHELRGHTGHDLVWIGSMETLFVLDKGGNQAFSFRIGDGLEWASLQPDLYPLRGAGGRGLIQSEGRAWFDTEGGARLGVVPLTASRRRWYSSASATLTLAPADSGLPACRWHRVILEGAIPGGCAIRVRSRASDRRDALDDLAWQDEPLFSPRSRSELPGRTPAPGEAVFDLLLQRCDGRHLQLQLEFLGTATLTPRIRSLRVYYPRFSYLERYLPEVWSADAGSASFTERFLANLEGLFTDQEDWISAFQLWLDPRTAPAEALPWLATWFAVQLDPSWGEVRTRFFLKNAARMFRIRGTAAGVAAAVRLALAETPGPEVFEADPTIVRVWEAFRDRPGLDREELVRHAHRLLITVPAPEDPADQPDLVRRVERVVAGAVPAHVRYWVGCHLPGLQLDAETLGAPLAPLPGSVWTARLDHAALGRSWLSPAGEPQERAVLDRDRLNPSLTLGPLENP